MASLTQLYGRTKNRIGVAMMELGSRLAGVAGFPYDSNTKEVKWERLSPLQRYELAWAYYRSNNLYQSINEALGYVATAGQIPKPLRNPVFRCVEFHATHLWPGDLPDSLPMETESDAVTAAVHQIWAWSNWQQRKQVAARWYAMFGDLILKVATKNVEVFDDPGAEEPSGTSITRVYLQLIDPRDLTEFEKDERGFFTSLRLDVPAGTNTAGQPLFHTEFWDKLSYRFYLHTKSRGEPESQLGAPVSEGYLDDIAPGMDFVPFTHAKFHDAGTERGWPCFWPAIEKIDEANRHITRAGSLMLRHNKAIWAARANTVGPNGEIIPAPSFRKDGGTEYEAGTFKDGDIVELPGNASLDSLSPSIDWDAALAYVKDQMLELQQDLPELRYSDLASVANIATNTVMKFLAPAIDRAAEARGNAEDALLRAQQMAITIGKAAGLPQFADIPERAYESGTLKMRFIERPILTESSAEKAATAQAWTAAGAVLPTAMRLAGMGDDEINLAKKDAQEERARSVSSLGAALLQRQREFNSGQTGNTAGNTGQPAQNQEENV